MTRLMRKCERLYGTRRHLITTRKKKRREERRVEENEVLDMTKMTRYKNARLCNGENER